MAGEPMKDLRQIPFTPQDYSRYKEKIKPYDNKVCNGEPLTEADRNYLKNFKEELKRTYEPNSLVQFPIFGEIGDILDLDDIRLQSQREEELREESISLMHRARIEREKGTLTDEEENKIYSRIGEIHKYLDPIHYNG